MNGLGVAGAMFLDSAYGNSNVPLIIAPQSLSDTAANSMTMYRSNIDSLPAGSNKTQFSNSTGYTSNSIEISNDSQFTSKKYVDDAISLINTEGGGIQSELIDSNAVDGNIYRLKIANDQIELYRNDNDNFLNIFGSTNSVIFDTPKVDTFDECSLDSA